MKTGGIHTVSSITGTADCYCKCPVCKGVKIIPLHSKDLPKEWIPVIFDE